jgi:hypothetical protein
VGESVAPKLDGTTPYRMIGIPDGMGGFDNGDGTFTLLSNHELGSGAGTARVHGATGATVSAWRVDRETLEFLSGGDLIRDVMTWNFANQNWDLGAAVAFDRFCSGDLADASAYGNPANGKGTRARLFLAGEETTAGQAFAHIASGPNTGVSYELPRLGREAWENLVASPFPQDKTVVVALDDSSPGQVYVYVGTKSAAGNEVQRAGLANGTLYGVRANGLASEDRTTAVGGAKGAAVPFTLVALPDQSASATDTHADAVAAGATLFLRPEDGAWDPSAPNDFYFVTTDRFDSNKNGTGTTVGRSRLWRLRFTSVQTPENGGSITMLLDGTEPHNMFDNLCVSRTGFVMIQEDPGGSSWSARIWRYEIATGTLTEICRHDAARFGDEATAPVAPFTNNEEASGIFDASDLLGPGWFLMCDQAHYSLADAELVEGGQFLALFDPATAPSPAFAATASAAPGRALVGQPVTFRASASVPGDGVLAYSWDFDDGGQAAGPVVQHAFDLPGTYDVVCTVTHAPTGRTAQSTVQAEVAKPATLGTSLKVILNFASPGRDSLAFRAEFPVPAGFAVSGKQVAVDVGGVVRTFTLDAAGSGSVADGTAKLLVKRTGSAVGAQRARFAMTLKNASLQAPLATLGMADADVPGALVTVPIEVVFDGTTYQGSADLLYKAKAGKKGVAQ